MEGESKVLKFKKLRSDCNTTCLLLFILYDDLILKIAIKMNTKDLPEEIEIPMGPETAKIIEENLPPFVRDLGPIVGWEYIFDVHVGK